MSVVQGHMIRIGKKNLFRIKLSDIPLTIFILGYLFLTSLPLLYTIFMAFKPLDEMFVYPPRWIPENPTLTNFSMMSDLLEKTVMPISRYIFNSIVYCTVMVLSVTIVSFMAAFSMTKIRPIGSKQMINVLIFALSLSGPAAGVARFIIIEKLGLVNTFWALILPGLCSSTYVFLMRQFFVSMPESYVEAARLDGANEWQVLWKIAFPYARPAIATVIVYEFMATWSDGSGPFLYLSEPDLMTLPFAISTLGGSLTTRGASAAISLLMLIPSTVVFVAMRSGIMKTMAYAGIKD